MNIDMGAVVSNSSSASNDDMRWFEQVLKDHPNNPTVVVSHDIFKCSNSRPNEISSMTIPDTTVKPVTMKVPARKSVTL